MELRPYGGYREAHTGIASDSLIQQDDKASSGFLFLKKKFSGQYFKITKYKL